VTTPTSGPRQQTSIRIGGVVGNTEFVKVNRVVQEPDEVGDKYRACSVHSRGDIMKIGVPMEPEGETRVAIVPGSMKKLMKSGFEVVIEKGAGNAANYLDRCWSYSR
jgi:hypothetical protein